MLWHSICAVLAARAFKSILSHCRCPDVFRIGLITVLSDKWIDMTPRIKVQWMMFEIFDEELWV